MIQIKNDLKFEGPIDVLSYPFVVHQWEMTLMNVIHDKQGTGGKTWHLACP